MPLNARLLRECADKLETPGNEEPLLVARRLRELADEVVATQQHHDPDAQAAMLAGLEQVRANLLDGRWDLVPYSRLRRVAEVSVQLTTKGLTAWDMMLLGSFLVASARTQIEAGA